MYGIGQPSYSGSDRLLNSKGEGTPPFDLTARIGQIQWTYIEISFRRGQIWYAISALSRFWALLVSGISRPCT